jgi:hypothetical protein
MPIERPMETPMPEGSPPTEARPSLENLNQGFRHVKTRLSGLTEQLGRYPDPADPNRLHVQNDMNKVRLVKMGLYEQAQRYGYLDGVAEAAKYFADVPEGRASYDAEKQTKVDQILEDRDNEIVFDFFRENVAEYQVQNVANTEARGIPQRPPQPQEDRVRPEELPFGMNIGDIREMAEMQGMSERDVISQLRQAEDERIRQLAQREGISEGEARNMFRQQVAQAREAPGPRGGREGMESEIPKIRGRLLDRSELRTVKVRTAYGYLKDVYIPADDDLALAWVRETLNGIESIPEPNGGDLYSLELSEQAQMILALRKSVEVRDRKLGTQMYEELKGRLIFHQVYLGFESAGSVGAVVETIQKIRSEQLQPVLDHEEVMHAFSYYDNPEHAQEYIGKVGGRPKADGNIEGTVEEFRLQAAKDVYDKYHGEHDIVIKERNRDRRDLIFAKVDQHLNLLSEEERQTIRAADPTTKEGLETVNNLIHKINEAVTRREGNTANVGDKLVPAFERLMEVEDYRWSVVLAEHFWATTGRMAWHDKGFKAAWQAGNGGNYFLRRLLNFEEYLKDSGVKNFHALYQLIYPDDPSRRVDIDQGDMFSKKLLTSMDDYFQKYYRDLIRTHATEDPTGRYVIDDNGKRIDVPVGQEEKVLAWEARERIAEITRVEIDGVEITGTKSFYKLKKDPRTGTEIETEELEAWPEIVQARVIRDTLYKVAVTNPDIGMSQTEIEALYKRSPREMLKKVTSLSESLRRSLKLTEIDLYRRGRTLEDLSFLKNREVRALMFGPQPYLDWSIYQLDGPDKVRDGMLGKVNAFLRHPSSESAIALGDSLSYLGSKQHKAKIILVGNLARMFMTDETYDLGFGKFDKQMANAMIGNVGRGLGLHQADVQEIAENVVGTDLYNQLLYAVDLFKPDKFFMLFLYQLIVGILSEGMKSK